MCLRWEQSGSVGSSFPERGETDFAGNKLVALDPASLVRVKLASLGVVDPALLVGVKLASLGACW